MEALLYTCYVAMGLQMKASRRVLTLRDAFNDEYAAGRMYVARDLCDGVVFIRYSTICLSITFAV